MTATTMAHATGTEAIAAELMLLPLTVTIASALTAPTKNRSLLVTPALTSSQDHA